MGAGQRYPPAMLGAAPFIGFVPVRDLDRARAFYVDVLGLEGRELSPFALELGAAGQQLRATLVEDFTPQPFTIAGWEVDDIATAIEQLAARGVAFERYDGFDQDDLGVWQAPSGARIAWFLDPDGNNLSLTQSPD